MQSRVRLARNNTQWTNPYIDTIAAETGNVNCCAVVEGGAAINSASHGNRTNGGLYRLVQNGGAKVPRRTHPFNRASLSTRLTQHISKNKAIKCWFRRACVMEATLASKLVGLSSSQVGSEGCSWRRPPNVSLSDSTTKQPNPTSNQRRNHTWKGKESGVTERSGPG